MSDIVNEIVETMSNNKDAVSVLATQIAEQLTLIKQLKSSKQKLDQVKPAVRVEERRLYRTRHGLPV